MCEKHYKKCAMIPKEEKESMACPHQEPMGEDGEVMLSVNDEMKGKDAVEIRRQISRISLIEVDDESVELEDKDITASEREVNWQDVNPAMEEGETSTAEKNLNFPLQYPIPWKRKSLGNPSATHRHRDSVSSCEWFDAEDDQRQKVTSTNPKCEVSSETVELATSDEPCEVTPNAGIPEIVVPVEESEKNEKVVNGAESNAKICKERSKTESSNDSDSDDDISSDVYAKLRDLEEENFRLQAVDSLMKKVMQALVGIDARLQELEAENLKRKQREKDVRNDIMALESQLIRIQDVQADLWPDDYNRARSVSLPPPATPSTTGEIENLRKEMEAFSKKTSMALKQMEAFQQISGEVLVWKITEYARKKYDEFKQKVPFYTSDSFYTRNFGYKMKLRVYLNGHGAGRDSHLSVFLHLTKGKNDHVLTWPFRNKLMVVLCDQHQGKNDHSRVLDPLEDPKNNAFKQPSGKTLNDGKGFELFIQCQEIESHKQPYLKDDSIILKVINLHRLQTMISITQ